MVKGHLNVFSQEEFTSYLRLEPASLALSLYNGLTWKTVKLDLIAQNKSLNITLFCDPEVFHHTYGTSEFFSNLSWTIAKILMEVVTIRSIILPLALCIFKMTVRFSPIFN